MLWWLCSSVICERSTITILASLDAITCVPLFVCCPPTSQILILHLCSYVRLPIYPFPLVLPFSISLFCVSFGLCFVIFSSFSSSRRQAISLSSRQTRVSTYKPHTVSFIVAFLSDLGYMNPHTFIQSPSRHDFPLRSES